MESLAAEKCSSEEADAIVALIKQEPKATSPSPDNDDDDLSDKVDDNFEGITAAISVADMLEQVLEGPLSMGTLPRNYFCLLISIAHSETSHANLVLPIHKFY